jgi:tRNA-modifying protein YgfZ
MPSNFAIFSWPVLAVRGPDRAVWLSGIITCDLVGLGGDRAAWGLLLTKQGKIQAELLVIPAADELLLAVVGGDPGETLRALERYLVMEDAEVLVAPRRALAVLVDVSSSDLRSPLLDAAAEVFRGAFPMAPDSAVLVVAEGDADALRARLAALSVEFSADEWMAFRVEQGIAEYGLDYSAADNPHEASLERRTVNWQKGCYLGQEVVFMQEARGKVKRRLVRLLPDAAWQLAPPHDVFDAAGRVVGRVTSSSSSGAIASVITPLYESGAHVVVCGHLAAVAPLVAPLG